MRPRIPLYTAEALADLRRLEFFIGLDDRSYAKRYVTELRTYIRNAAAKGLTGTERPEFGPDLRSLTYDRQVIIFTVSTDHLSIVHIRDGSQNIPSLFHSPAHE